MSGGSLNRSEGAKTADLVGTTIAGRYQIQRLIDQGAMGSIFEARHAVLGQRLAVKVLKQRGDVAAKRERFLHEARAAAAINHENVVRVFDFGLLEQSGAPYLVMEYVDGENLETIIGHRAPLEIDDAVEIAAQVLSALEMMHGSGLIHRDIKPANIVLAPARRRRIHAKLVDFGVARALASGWKRPQLTAVDQVLGTPAYLSPEQAGGSSAADPRWDLWAVTTILYEMLSGKLPYRLDSLEQLTTDISTCRLTPLQQYRPDLPRWLIEVVQRGHHPSINCRFGTATAFLQALEQRAARVSDDDMMARTVPFYRVETITPPPELLHRMKAPNRGSPGVVGPGDQIIDKKGAKSRQEPEVLDSVETSEKVPASLGDDDKTSPLLRSEQPQPRSRLLERAMGRMSEQQLRWLMFGVLLAVVLTLAVSLYSLVA